MGFVFLNPEIIIMMEECMNPNICDIAINSVDPVNNSMPMGSYDPVTGYWNGSMISVSPSGTNRQLPPAPAVSTHDSTIISSDRVETAPIANLYLSCTRSSPYLPAHLYPYPPDFPSDYHPTYISPNLSRFHVGAASDNPGQLGEGTQGICPHSDHSDLCIGSSEQECNENMDILSSGSSLTSEGGGELQSRAVANKTTGCSNAEIVVQNLQNTSENSVNKGNAAAKLFTKVQMVEMAIKSSTCKKATCREILKWLSDNFPEQFSYEKNKLKKNLRRIQSLLATYKAFYKDGKPDGKPESVRGVRGCYWAVKESEIRRSGSRHYFPKHIQYKSTYK